jgi:hypothetical protein
MPDSRVYILGAGCSKDCGYPLGPEMKDDLERFGRSLDPATSPRLLQAVKGTVDLLVGTTDTVDILVQKLYGGHLDSQIGGNQNRHPCVVSATLATVAAFLAKEPAARQTGLKQYREFISISSLVQKVVGHGYHRQSGFAFDKYVRGVWTRASELIANATEIHVIGYSFAGIDRGPILDMIETASDCRRLIIQGPDAERICARLRLDRPQLRDLIESAPFKFWR